MDHVWPQELACTGRFLHQSVLSAGPVSNIHLAWCIPGLETLMWFVGESRWQVHGSTLLTDSAGASSMVRSNTQWPSLPFSLFCQRIYIINRNLLSAHTLFFFLVSMFIPGDCTGSHSACWHSAQLSSISLPISCFPPFSQSLLFSASFSLYLSLCMCISSVLFHYTHSCSLYTLAQAPQLIHPIILWLLFTPSIIRLIPVSSPLLTLVYICPLSMYWKSHVLSSHCVLSGDDVMQ